MDNFIMEHPVIRVLFLKVLFSLSKLYFLRQTKSLFSWCNATTYKCKRKSNPISQTFWKCQNDRPPLRPFIQSYACMNVVILYKKAKLKTQKKKFSCKIVLDSRNKHSAGCHFFTSSDCHWRFLCHHAFFYLALYW